jgi:hypothetical protein
MPSILEILTKLASDLDEMEALEYADQVDDISAIMTGVDVSSGQHMPSGDTQWSLPSVGVNMSKDAMGLNDIPIGDAPYANRMGIPEDDMDKQFLGGEEEGVAMPPINDKYEMGLELDDHLDSLEAALFDMGLRKEAKEVYIIRTAITDEDPKIRELKNLARELNGYGVTDEMLQRILDGDLKLDRAIVESRVHASKYVDVQSALKRYVALAPEVAKLTGERKPDRREDPKIRELKNLARELNGYGVTDEMLQRILDGDLKLDLAIVESRVHASKYVDVQSALKRYVALAGERKPDRREELFNILVHQYHVPTDWLSNYDNATTHGVAPKSILGMWDIVKKRDDGLKDSKSEEFVKLMTEWYSRYGRGGSPLDEPSASGPRSGRPDTREPQAKSNGLIELQTRLNVNQDGFWGDITRAAWEAFIDDPAVPYLKSKDQELTTEDIQSMKGDWGTAGPQLGYDASYGGMVDFFDAVSPADANAPDQPAPAATGEAPPTNEPPDVPGDVAPVASDEIRTALLYLSQNKVPHQMEAAGLDPEKSLGGGYSKRRTNRYMRHLDKLMEGEGDAYTKVAEYLTENYSEELTKILAEAQEFHESEDNGQSTPWGDGHRYEHLISKVYELLQRAWGDLSGEAGKGGRDRRSERMQNRQENRGRRRLRNQK